MSMFILWFSVAMVTFVAALLVAMPALVRPTVPLGVSIPRARVDEPVVARAVRGYRIAVVASWILALVLVLLLATTAPVATSIAPMLLVLLLAAVSYLVARRAIIRAKRVDGWYEQVSVRLRAQVTADAAAPRPPLGWTIAALVILAVIVAVGVVAYPSIPDPTPVHWNGAGRIDGYAPKSVWSVFGSVLVGLGVLALLFGCSFLARLSPLRAPASEDPAEAARRALAQRRQTMSLLGALSVVTSVMIGWLAVVSWLAPRASALVVTGLIVGVALMIGVLVVFALRYRHAVAPRDGSFSDGSFSAGSSSDGPSSDGPSSIASSGNVRPDAPDDDRFWRGGMIYLNRGDPAVFVPKRFGIGWTINLGSVGGLAIGALLVVVIVGGVVAAIVAPGSAHS